jgi:geranylgeranyl pyrophosphate synthase
VHKTAFLTSPPAPLVCPAAKSLRERLRAIAADTVAAWRSDGVPAEIRSPSGLRRWAESIVARTGAAPELSGWTMVTLVSEYWRNRLAAGGSGRRLLLLPDCPRCLDTSAVETGMPLTCGPSCGIATIWAAARDCGWAVEPTSRAVAAIGSLLTGQYDGILGLARLRDLEKAFGMLPAFSLPVAAVPYEPALEDGSRHHSCAAALADAAIDVEWVLGLLGVAGGAAAPVGDYLPLLREAAEMFSPTALADLARDVSQPGLLGDGGPGFNTDSATPLEATAAMSADFLARGGKFLRPFVTLAAYDAVVADRGDQPVTVPAEPIAPRTAARAAAVAIEIFHKASLVHDDIEDDDTMRYGRPTLHVERGLPSALNAGDYLLGTGYRLVSLLPGVEPRTTADLVGILADAHVRLARGQGAELWWRDAGGGQLTPAEALAIYGLKTSPAFEAAIAMGIRLAGLQPESLAAISRYALHVGTGFQVLNDLKDWGGDLENDRRAAGDLLGGRPTLLWSLAIERLAPTDVARLREISIRASREDLSATVATELMQEARHLYNQAAVVPRATAIAALQRRSAADALTGCRHRRLREVLDFLLDLAVPEPAPAA